MEWFKYTEKKYALKMIQEGSIRLGTLNEYRQEEHYGKAIGDRDEGKKLQYSADTGIKTRSEDLNWMERKLYDPGQGSNSTNLVFSNNVIRLRTIISDAYLYCVCREFDLDVIRKINEENLRANRKPYDVCVKISDPLQFAKVLERSFLKNRKDWRSTCDDCRYFGRIFRWDQNQNTETIFLKPPELSYQKEVRVAFLPHKPTSVIHGLIVTIPSLRRFFSLVEF